jgi:hypothetical protein
MEGQSRDAAAFVGKLLTSLKALNNITDLRWYPVPKGDAPTYDCATGSADDRELCLIDRYEACAVDLTCPYSALPCDLTAQLKLSTFASCLEYDHQCSNHTWAGTHFAVLIVRAPESGPASLALPSSRCRSCLGPVSDVAAPDWLGHQARLSSRTSEGGRLQSLARRLRPWMWTRSTRASPQPQRLRK